MMEYERERSDCNGESKGMAFKSANRLHPSQLLTSLKYEKAFCHLMDRQNLLKKSPLSNPVKLARNFYLVLQYTTMYL